MPQNLKLFLVTIRRDGGIIERRFSHVDMTYLSEDDVIESMQYELNGEFPWDSTTFDILPLCRIRRLNELI